MTHRSAIIKPDPDGETSHSGRPSMELNASSFKFDLPPAERHEQLVNNEFLADILFYVGSSRKVMYAHQNIIALASELLFKKSLKAKPDSDGRIHISVEDVEPDTFLEVLRYIYCRKVSITTENMLSISYASKKYNLGSLQRRCEEALHQMKTQNAAEHQEVLLDSSSLDNDSSTNSSSTTDSASNDSSNLEVAIKTEVEHRTKKNKKRTAVEAEIADNMKAQEPPAKKGTIWARKGYQTKWNEIPNNREKAEKNAGGSHKRTEKKAEEQLIPNDWECPICKFYNFAYRGFCLRCKHCR